MSCSAVCSPVGSGSTKAGTDVEFCPPVRANGFRRLHASLSHLFGPSWCAASRDIGTGSVLHRPLTKPRSTLGPISGHRHRCSRRCGMRREPCPVSELSRQMLRCGYPWRFRSHRVRFSNEHDEIVHTTNVPPTQSRRGRTNCCLTTRDTLPAASRWIARVRHSPLVHAVAL